ncbi:hypothetical protein [Thiocapsa rosea]|uniref:hypothetical protein n=1 Tax=Thiocapsa rosea TaxID=69360 RepID=UPI0014767BDC|nr:hypothetical protein [Thiocapsa rosea]
MNPELERVLQVLADHREVMDVRSAGSGQRPGVADPEELKGPGTLDRLGEGQL